MRAFLDETYDRQLKILSYIDNKKKIVSVKQISENTNLSEKTVLQVIRRFEQEFSFSDNQFQIIYANKTIKGIYAENLDLMSIASECIKKSVLYKIIRTIFLYEKVDAKKFCDLEYISPPTFSRYRQRLAAILEKFDLQLTRDNQIQGNELKVRNFFYLFFCYSSSKWEFSEQEYREIETTIYKYVENWQTLNQVRQRKICLLIYISNIRSSQKYYCKNDVLTKLTKQGLFEYKNVLVDYFNSKKNRTIDQVWHEVSFVELLMYKEDLSLREIDYDRYELFYNDHNFPFIQQSNLLTEIIIQTFFSGASRENKELFLQVRQEIDKMHLVFNTCYADLSIFYYVYDTSNFYYRDAAEKKIIGQVERIVEEITTSTIYQPWWEVLTISKEAFVNSLYLLIYALLNKLHEYKYEPVKIMVQNSKVFIEEIIVNKLALIFGDRIQLVPTFRDSPDLLVTDIQLLDTPEQTREIFVTSFSDYADINNAIFEIQKEIIQNYGQREITQQLVSLN
ncbi:hypothetical protein A5821_002141 [Enterococcus sp. 7F3_DIV0205]|uniref:Mga helix-turn-helix domain-containing protein n=1 Tax=Candidatus Enterococcus palustris TaxID=1834189 RepID=A0AAQ3Y7R6_9ENTE|nr:helix-turn-helix domain-containing protein [Enterococcus sp. 7F3_DIV0205]OTN82580.1 hypothetical protein A5821_002491 [Enterococcus sp. 7F3_DIV0205]